MTYILRYNNQYGIKNNECSSKSEQQKIFDLIPKNFKVFGAPVVLLSTEVC